MDFNDTPEEAAYRKRVRDFLEANAVKKAPGLQENVKLSVEETVTRAKAWQLKKYEAGFAGILIAKEHGGQGGKPIEQVIYNQEESNYLVPRGVYEIGLGMCIPTMLTYATDEQKQRYATPALRGEEIWCQLFSEPVAGSDVAGLITRCERDGDDWIINGQKVWTSGAHFCDYGVIVVRSDPNVPKHKGLSYFFIDMKSPGIEVRQIHQVSGASNFNEVYFTDVRVPDAQRLGAVGDGWKVAITTLMNERLAVGQTPAPDFPEIFDYVKGLELDSGPALEDSATREKMAGWYVKMMGLKWGRFRTIAALSRGEQPGPESSIIKVVSARKRQEIAEFAMDLMDMGGIENDDATSPVFAMFQDAFLSSPGSRIAGGTDEILRNIISERVLGLPQDIRVDKDVSFNALRGGKA